MVMQGNRSAHDHMMTRVDILVSIIGMFTGIFWFGWGMVMVSAVVMVIAIAMILMDDMRPGHERREG